MYEVVMPEVTGMFGWKQFDRNRKDILAEFDRMVELIEERPVPTEHGDALEAIVRKWLEEFLPSKYAVTSGYVIPNIYNPGMKLYHSDIIIYNRLEAPVLWTQDNADQSEQGKYRAIPAKHIVALYEVKAQVTDKSIKDAIDKLCEINDFSSEFPANFHSGIIFGYLKRENRNKHRFLEKLATAKTAFGFKNGMILRYEGDESICAHISALENVPEDSRENFPTRPIVCPMNELGEIIKNDDGSVTINNTDENKIASASIVSLGDGGYGVTRHYSRWFNIDGYALCLNWTIDNFSEFAIQLLIHLDGNGAPVQNFSFGKMFEKTV